MALTANIRLRWTHELTWVGNKGSREIGLWISQSLSPFRLLLETELVLLVQLEHFLASLHFTNYLKFYSWWYLVKNFIQCVLNGDIKKNISEVIAKLNVALYSDMSVRGDRKQSERRGSKMKTVGH